MTTTLAAPWGLCRPPITTMSDTFTYALPTSFVPASKRSLVLAPDVGWLQPEMAPKPTLANGIQMHREVRPRLRVQGFFFCTAQCGTLSQLSLTAHKNHTGGSSRMAFFEVRA